VIRAENTMFLKKSCLTALFLVLASPVAGQEATDVSDSLVIEYRTVMGQAWKYSDLRNSTSGEDSMVVVYELERSVLEAADVLRNLAAAIKPEEGEPAVSDPEVIAEFRDLAELLWASEGAVRTRLDAARLDYSQASGSEARSYERTLIERERRMTLVYSVLLDHVFAMQSIGLDADADHDRLVEVTVARATMLAARIGYLRTSAGDLAAQAEVYPNDAEIIDLMQSVERRRQLYVEALDATVRQLGLLDQPTAEFQNVLVRNTGDIARSILDPAVASSLFSDWWESAREWVGDNGVGLLIKVVIFLIILGLSWGAARVVRRAVEQGLNGPKVKISHLLRKMIIGFSGNLVMLTGLLIGLSQLGVNLAPILAGVGVVGFIVGFALQDTLANFAAGLMILFYRPYDVGDLVEVSGVFGKVSHMSLVSTTILTLDHQTLVVPNGKIWGDVIRNVTAQRIRRVDLVFGISYTDDIPKAEAILASIVADHSKVLGDPEPMIKLHTLNESSVDFVVRPWAKTEDYWDVYWDVTREVKIRFDAEGVSIPFPQRDVHHYVDGLPALLAATTTEADRTSRPASGIVDDPDAAEGDDD
jgi:small conductance mechanosensitive channel